MSVTCGANPDASMPKNSPRPRQPRRRERSCSRTPAPGLDARTPREEPPGVGTPKPPNTTQPEKES